MSATSNPIWLTLLIAGVGSALTLLVTFATWFFRRPNLHLSISQGAPNLVTVPYRVKPDGGSNRGGQATWLRISAKNNGWRTAKGRAFLIFLCRRGDAPIIDREAIDLWASAGGDGHRHELQIPRGVVRHFDLASVLDQPSGPPKLVLPSEYFPHRWTSDLALGSYVMGAVVVGEGFDSREVWCLVETSPTATMTYRQLPNRASAEKLARA